MRKTESLVIESRLALGIALLIAAACTPPPQWIVVAGGDDHRLLLFDPDLSSVDTLILAPTAFPPTSPSLVEAGSDGVSLFVAVNADPGPAGISRIGRVDGAVLQRWLLPSGAPIQIATLADSLGVIVTAKAEHDTVSGSVYYLSADSQNRFEPCAGSPQAFVALHEIGRGYARCSGAAESISDFDLVQRRIVRTVSLNDPSGTDPGKCGPGGIALSRNGTVVLVPCSISGQLLYLDRLSLDVIDSAPVGPGAYEITVLPIGSRALVTNPDSSNVAMVGLRDRRVTARMALPGPPRALVVSGDGKKGYVVTGGVAPRLVLLDLEQNEVDTVAAVPAGTRSLAVWPGATSPVIWW